MRFRLLSSIVAVALIAPLGLAAPSASSQVAQRPDRPAVVRAKVIGHSEQGKPIWAWQLGDPKARRTIVAMSAMHGNELAPRTILRTLRNGPRIRDLNLWIVPTVNPDGARREQRKNAHGVDLNRNYPVRWKDLDGAYESGPHPRSERETRVVMRFLRHKQPKYVVSFHQPLKGVDAGHPKSPRLVNRLSRNLNLPKKAFRCGGYCHGTMTQWFNRREPGAAVTVELGTSPTKHYLTEVAPRGLLHAVRPRR